ncbi:serine/threonine-protein phosphatase 2A 65 kDa regulatory subunit A alpha isoform-like isoform X1 [Aphis gossypii]|uniref:serine/threonine-protein phosphatase 2A 65 kDa regulatory subunit A alpha isoform-like isoform X1 n=1 Tax=Aphis gossypii TaxID=80765 RepID=UPI0021590D4B|nr:serine/threonine-protein phosphatase 2A 65 kDa regulatory subunit A alpha isoform-like isoform X1 [Aphis gossypii]
MAERIEQGISETYRGDNHLELHDDHLQSRSFIETTVNCDRLVNRLESMNFLRDVALKLGVENTRKHLVPYLTHLIIAEKLSELKNLAEVLGEFENYVGGPKYAHILLLPLEELAGAKVNDVRMAAIKSLQTLADIMEVIDLENFFIPFIASLTMNDESAKRMSVSHLFTTVYMRVSPKYQSDLIDYHCFLSLDSSPAVRQNAANNLVDFSEVVHMSIFDSKLTPRLEQFSFDQNEHVRILALSTAITISKKFDVSYTKEIILPIVLNSINDPSCGVRSILIKNIAKNLIELPEDRLICSLKAFIINSSWKMRNTGAIYLYILAIQKGLKFFEDYLEQSFLILLTDPKSTVQQTAMDVFKQLVTEFGMDWAQTYIVPYLIKLSYSRNTYNKMAFLSFAKVCAIIMCIQFRILNINMKENAVE